MPGSCIIIYPVIMGWLVDMAYIQFFDTQSVYFLAVNKPIIESLERVSLTEVRVEWSQPREGANVTGYVVLYYDGSVTRNQTAPATATSAIITVDSHTLTYAISVMVLSDKPFHLPGRSVWKIIEMCELNIIQLQ